MKRIYLLLTLLLGVFMLKSCSTDFDVAGNYEETTIVYGMMDQSETRHYIRVNKSFLGAGDAQLYALIRDSSEYEMVEGVVEEWLNGSPTGRQWAIRDTVLSDREDGAFYGPEYTTYYFDEPSLNEDAEYRLTLDINEGEKEVTSSTTLIGNVTFHQQTSNATVMGFYNGTSYSTYPVKFYNSENGKQFDVVLRMNWVEISGTDTVAKFLDWNIGSEVVDDSKMDEPNQYELIEEASGEAFFQFIANSIDADASIDKRIFKGINIIVTAASLDLYTYMIVNSPSNGLVQERPQFTNINNGIGLFSSRFNRILARRPLNKNTLQYLCTGPVTGHLGFCSDTVIYSAESFFCQ